MHKPITHNCGTSSVNDNKNYKNKCYKLQAGSDFKKLWAVDNPGQKFTPAPAAAPTQSA